jgi:predicted small integral membrane protein
MNWTAFFLFNLICALITGVAVWLATSPTRKDKS